jgi:hypothetical protein
VGRRWRRGGRGVTISAVTPAAAVIEYIKARGGAPRLPASGGATDPSGWRGVVVGSDVERAPVRAETIRLLKQREIPGRALFAVAYHDVDGNDWHGVLEARLRPDGTWRAAGGGLGVGRVTFATLRVGLAGTTGPRGYALGGHVSGPGSDTVAVVELDDGNRDTVDDGIVLFLSDHNAMDGRTARLLAADGTVLAEHRVP